MKTSLAYPKTKIVATLGPSSLDIATIVDMLNAGLSVARINMSHGDHESHHRAMRNARTAAKRAGKPLAILQDLAGPKIRIGDFETETVTLTPGAHFTLTTRACTGTENRVWVNYPKLPREVTPGMSIFLSDGKLELCVQEVTETDILTTVVHGGTIRGRRGVNIPDGNLSIATITPKDKRDLVFGLGEQVDFVTLSFVRTEQDIHDLRKLIAKHTDRPIAIVAKIETKSAIEHIDAIIGAADAVMVARGDLAIEVPPEKVPLLQKTIIRKANCAGKPVITATQMLDSMRTEATPTRAEVNDIANAILDGTDAIMLSDETAVGKHPVKPVEVMARVAREVESDPHFITLRQLHDFSPTSTYEVVGQSIAHTAATVDARFIVTFSESGSTSRTVARYRPQSPILVLTPHRLTFNQSLLVFGCEPVLIKRTRNLSDARAIARTILKEHYGAHSGDVFVLGAGIPFGAAGATNLVLVEHL